MTTVTISLPTQIAKRIDHETKNQGYATRSEFFRTILRKYFSITREELKFEPFVPRPLNEIEEEFRKTGKYNEKFIKSLIKGLRENSSFYAGKNSQP